MQRALPASCAAQADLSPRLSGCEICGLDCGVGRWSCWRERFASWPDFPYVIQPKKVSPGVCEYQDSRIEGRPVREKELKGGDDFGSARCHLLPRTYTKIASSQID